MSSNNGNASFGTSLLLTAFIVLKLTGVIDWSWWWVMAPVWIPLALAAVAGIVWPVLWVRLQKKPAKRRGAL